jgi:hypothetical protein
VCCHALTSNLAIVQTGTPLKVLRNDRWRSASMRRMHRDGSFKVVFRDGSSEARVSIDRIALTVDTVRALSDWHTCTADTENKTEERLEAAFRAASMDSTGYPDSEPLSSPDTSSYALLSNQVHSFRTEDLRSTESFVVEGGEDLNKWIESEAVECEVERDRLSSVDSVWSTDGIGSSLYSPQEKEEGYDIIEAVYDQAPLGLRISSSRGSSNSSSPLLGLKGPLGETRPPDVTKVVTGGRSDGQGIRVGDELVSIDGRQVQDYHDAMAILQSSAYPLRLQFRRRTSTPSGRVAAKSSMVSGHALCMFEQCIDLLGFLTSCRFR